MIRVLVVEDSRFMRGVINTILSRDPDIEVVGSAADGLEAVDAVSALRPDVVTMDVDMPRADGLSAVERIMSERPTPIVMISAYTRRDSSAAIRALELGAVDFVAKPSFTVDLGLEALRDEIVSKVRMASRVRPVRTASRATAAPPSAVVATSSEPPNEDRRHWEATPCVLMAASTGGPAALLSLVPRLGGDFPAAVLIVQHMPAPYTTAFAGELAGRCALRVKEAVHGDWIERGVVYVCPGSHHLTLAPGGRVALHAPPTRDSECPSADLAMMSMARRVGARSIGVILTGMGRDGAAGARAIRRVRHAAGGRRGGRGERRAPARRHSPDAQRLRRRHRACGHARPACRLTGAAALATVDRAARAAWRCSRWRAWTTRSTRPACGICSRPDARRDDPSPSTGPRSR